LSVHNQDIVTTLRYHHITDEEISKISHETIMSRRDQLCTEYGLRSLPSILDKLKRERHLQTPQDVYHATAGKIGRCNPRYQGNHVIGRIINRKTKWMNNLPNGIRINKLPKE
jgi:hypothetical protein